MEYSIVFSGALLALAVAACDKKTVAVPPTPAVVTVPVPGPAGPTGATGATGEPGKSGGNTVVIVPPPAPSPQPETAPAK